MARRPGDVDGVTHHDVMSLFLGLAVLLGAARVFAEIARRLQQPGVIGEIVAGVVLGPTILGRIWPGLLGEIFPAAGPVADFRQGFEVLAVALFLLVAGMEVDLAAVWRQGRSAISVSVLGMVVPFLLGFLFAAAAPGLLGHARGDPLVFALFVGVALSISALPVIARTLLDLDLFRTEVGTVIVASAIVQDVAGWILFAALLGMMETAGAGLPVAATVAFTLGFSALVLTVGRWVANRALVVVQAHTTWPHGVLAAVLATALLGAAVAEAVGLHAIFGTFLVGVAVGSSRHLHGRTRGTIDGFVSAIFAPIFFAGIGLKVDFLAAFDPVLVGVVLVLATAGKLVGCVLGGRVAGMGDRETLAVAFGMNARGAMEIVLGLIALDAGLIGERLFVALVVMALVTSIASGPAMQWALGRRRALRFPEFASAATFVPDLAAADATEAIRRLARAVAPVAGVDPERVEAAVVEREQVLPTGLSDGLAVPHARLAGLARPVIAVGIPSRGIDFGAPDGTEAELVFLLLVPDPDDGAEIELLADISRTFHHAAVRERAVRARTFTELVAVARTAG